MASSYTSSGNNKKFSISINNRICKLKVKNKAVYFEGLLFFLKDGVNLGQWSDKLGSSQRLPCLLQDAAFGDDGLDHLDHVTCGVAIGDFGKGAEIQRLCDFSSLFFN